MRLASRNLDAEEPDDAIRQAHGPEPVEGLQFAPGRRSHGGVGSWAAQKSRSQQVSSEARLLLVPICNSSSMYCAPQTCCFVAAFLGQTLPSNGRARLIKRRDFCGEF